MRISCLVIFLIIISATSSSVYAISDDRLDTFAQNDILFYEPEECTSSGGPGSLCGKTPTEKYWSALRQEFDEVHAAAIFGSIDHEGVGGVARWEIGVIVSGDGGHFIRSWDTLYNCNPGNCPGGVGSFGITWTLGPYLRKINSDNPDLLKYFKDPANYSYPGEETLERIGDADYDRLVEQEVQYVINEADIESFKATSGLDEATDWWTKNYENCRDCCGTADTDKSCEQIALRRASAKKEYDAMKDFTCSASSSKTASSSNKSDGSKSSSSKNTCAKLGELRTDMWNKASQADKESFMKTVSEENYSIAGVEGYMNQIVAKYGSDGTLHDWLTGQCEAFRPASATCTGSHTINSEEQGWIDEALAGSNNIKFAVGNATGGSSVGAGKIVCVWDGTKCRDDVDYTKQDGKGGCNVYSPSANFGECWGLEGAEDWAKEMEENCGSDCTTYEGDYPEYLQGDEKWGGQSYGPGCTISLCGCGASSIAMLATVATGQDIFPNDVVDYLGDSRYWETADYGMVALDKKVCEKYGCEVEEVAFSSNDDMLEKMKQYLNNGYMIHLSGTCRGSGHSDHCPFSDGGHYVGIFSIKGDDTVMVADSGWGNKEYSLKDISSYPNPGAFSAVRGSGGSSCNNTCKNSDSSLEELTDEQAEKLATNYNNNTDDWDKKAGGGLFCEGSDCASKYSNCSLLSAFFVEMFTDLGTGQEWSNMFGGNVTNVLRDKGFEVGTEPKAFSVFSCGATDWGHTGVVVRVDGDELTTVEAGYPRQIGQVVHSTGHPSWCSSDNLTYAYLNDRMDIQKLKEFIEK